MLDRMTLRLHLFDQLMEETVWDGHGRSAVRGWKFLTLTYPVPRGESAEKTWSSRVLRYRIQTVRRAWIHFWRLTDWGRQVKGENGQRSRQDTAAVMSVEVGPSGGMVHIHALVYGEYIHQRELERCWGRALGRRAFVNVKAVTNAAEGLQETLKYAAKGTTTEVGLTPERAANLELAFRHVHRVSMLGALRRVKASPEDRAAYDDLRSDDVHARKVAACEDCGSIGDWRWNGVALEQHVKENGGFGPFRPERWHLPPGFRLTTEQLARFHLVEQSDADRSAGQPGDSAELGEGAGVRAPCLPCP